jgi:hypothetical protein
MMNKFLIIAIFVLSVQTLKAQKALTGDEIKSGLLTTYTNYFSENREMVYTQFNKSQYLTGDDIWFTSWVLNALNKQPLFHTSKLYAELWSGDKKLISRKILFVKDGTTSNFIHIADSLAPGTYCFRAYTNWMRNFYEDKDFNVPIIILGPAVKKINPVNAANLINNVASAENLKPVIKTDYDIQFLPEGGHFIEGVDNVFGVKVTDAAGHGISVKGKVVDSGNKEITSFNTNQLGMSSFTIADSINTTCHSVITLPNGSTHEEKLPETEKQGISLRINSHPEDEVLVRLQINPKARLLNQAYILMVHANGIKYHMYKIEFKEAPSVQINMNKSEMDNGIIYTTLFNEDFKPIAERLFYNQNSIIKGSLSLKTIALQNDSIKLTITASDSASKAQIANLSFSILPGDTRMNQFTTSLLAESRLRPALRGEIENPGYYFEKNDAVHLNALDNLMLTQGWRKYDWQEIAKNVPKQYAYIEENAFTINGAVRNWIKDKPELKSRVTLLSPQNNIMMQSTVDNEGKFSFFNLYLADSTSAIISATSISGAEWNRVLQISSTESQMEIPVLAQTTAIPLINGTANEEMPKLTKGAIQLGEVLVTAKRKDPFMNNPFVSSMSKQFEINKDNYTRYKNLEDLLKLQFNVLAYMTPNDGKYHFNMQRATKKNYLDQDIPIMTIDGIRVKDPIELLSYDLSVIETVAVDKSGTTGGMEGANGVIAITIRKKPLFEKTGDDMNLMRLKINGYAKPQRFFEPKYLITPENPDFSRYATLYWRPNVITDSNGIASFNFHVPNSIKSIFIRAEGINDAGLIFLDDEKITLTDR